MANVLTGRGQVIRSKADHSPEERQLLDRVRQDKEHSENARKPYEKRWVEWYGLHRAYQRFKDAHRAASEADRDEVIREGKREFGAELFVPYAFTVIETMTPALLMQNPRMKVKPKRKALHRERAEAVRMMFEERMREIDYALKLIPTARRGLKYGLGVSKNFWDMKERNTLALESNDLRARLTGRPHVVPRTERNEGPMTEDVEILPDFFWDGSAKDMETCRYAIHRTWRDLEYIRERVERRDWAPVDLEAVKRMAPETDRDTLVQERLAASGLKTDQPGTSAERRLHEIWEWHNGEQMVTVLDGQLLVQVGENPFAHGELPFSIFRPTLQEGEFVGIGEIEPIVSLQHEMNAIRSSRLDNMQLVMQKAFLYAEGLVDPADLIVGPGTGIPVQGGEIDHAIRPLNFGDLPGSSYQETAEIKADIELATAVSETVAGAQGTGNASETATGIQMVQAASNRRVEMKTKMLAHELVMRDTRQWLEMFRQHTLTQPREVMVEGPTGFEPIQITGEDLDLVEAVLPEDDSLTPEEGPQKRNDMLALFNQLQGAIQQGIVDPRKPARALIEAFDVPDPESWILPEQTQLNPQVAMVVGQAIQQTATEAGMDPEQAEQLALASVQAAMQAAGVSQPLQMQGQQNGAAAPQEA